MILLVAQHKITHSCNQANILINNSGHACLSDFGLSTVIGTNHHAGNGLSFQADSKVSFMSFTPGGTTRWMGPELLDPEMFGKSDDWPTKESDCYALGMVVYEVCTDAVFSTTLKI